MKIAEEPRKFIFCLLKLSVFVLELLKMIVAAATKAFRPRGNSIDLYFAWRDLGLHIMFGLKAYGVKFRK